MNSPIDIVQPVLYKDFKVQLNMNLLSVIQMRKQASNLIKIENNFGTVLFNNATYNMSNSYFRAPSEHKINGQRLPLEFQMIGESTSGDKVGLSVLFTIGDNVNWFLNELSFGKGYLKELPVSTQAYSKFYKVDTKISFSGLFTNKDSWLMYSGTDTNVPCDEITWLVSYDAVEVHPEQLYDFPTDSTPFFSTKSLGQRLIYRNQHNEEEKLDEIQKQEKMSNAEMKAKNAEDIRLEEERRKQMLAGAIENIQAKETEAILTAQKKIEAEKQKEREAAVKKIMDERAKVELQKNIEKLKQAEMDKLYPTTMLYERIMDRVRDAKIKPPSCPNFTTYEPPTGKAWGYVPPGMVMTWEILSYQNMNNTAIANPEYPQPKEIGLIYRPFYYKVKPDCEVLPDPHRPLIPKSTDNSVLPNGTMAALAQVDLFILDRKKSNLTTYIPVVVKTYPNVSSPTVPTNTFTMLNGTEIPANQTNQSYSGNSNATNNTPNVTVAPVKILREFQPDSIGQQQLDYAKSQNIVTKISPTGGYDVVPDPALAFASPKPNYFNESLPTSDRVVRVWPPLKAEWNEGTLPIDVKYAWNEIKESEMVVNLSPPKSPDPEFRWILFFWMEAFYGLGTDKKPPWVPVYILARSDFKWDRNQMPIEIPVPYNLTKDKNGKLPVAYLKPNFEPRKVEDLINNTALLNPPIGVDPEEAFQQPKSFRLQLEKQLLAQNPLYVKAIEEKYRAMPGMIGDLQIQRLEEETGIFVEADPYWRIMQEELELKRLAEEQGQVPVKSAPKSITRYERTCLEYDLEVVLNRRTLYDLDGVHEQAFQYCRKWGWKEYSTPINQIVSDNSSITTNSTNNTNSTNSTKPESEPNAPPVDLAEKAKKSLNEKCHEYLQIVLNRHKYFHKNSIDDYMEKECEPVFVKMREERLRNFKGGLEPFLNVVKDTVEKSKQYLKNSAEQARENLREIIPQKPNFNYTGVQTDLTDPRNLGPQRLLAQRLNL